MALRDAPFRRHDILVLLAGTTVGVEAVSKALVELVAMPGRGVLRRRWPSALHSRVHRVEAARRLAASSIHVVSASLTDEDLIEAARGSGYSGLPVAVTVTGDRIAVLLAHGVFDGFGAIEVAHDLIDLAHGRSLPTHLPKVRFPLISVLRRLRVEDVRRRGQRSADTPGALRVPGPRRPTRSAHFRLNADDLAALRRVARHRRRPGRATANSRIGAAVVTALRAIYLPEVDMRVRIPVDLRHLVPGRRVEGNFICGDVVGRLIGDEWDPVELNARLTDAASVSGALSIALHSARTIPRLLRPPRQTEMVLTVSLITDPRTFPLESGLMGPQSRLLCTTLGPDLVSALAFAWTVGGTTHLSVRDESGSFDLEAFESTFRTGELGGASPVDLLPTRSPIDDGASPGQPDAEPEQQRPAPRIEPPSLSSQHERNR